MANPPQRPARKTQAWSIRAMGLRRENGLQEIRSFNMFRSPALMFYSFLSGSGNPDCSSEESGRTEETD